MGLRPNPRGHPGTQVEGHFKSPSASSRTESSAAGEALLVQMALGRMKLGRPPGAVSHLARGGAAVTRVRVKRWAPQDCGDPRRPSKCQAALTTLAIDPPGNDLPAAPGALCGAALDVSSTQSFLAASVIARPLILLFIYTAL